MRQFFADVIWWIDDALFALHKKFFPKHYRESVERHPEKVTFLTNLGFRVLGLWKES